jgi:hypothetical protein
MQEIHVVIEKGVVQFVSPIPPGIVIVEVDHDMEQANPDDVVPSPLDDRPCVITRHGGDE